MATAISVKKQGAYGLVSAAALQIKVAGQYVPADTIKVKSNGAYAGTGVAPSNTTPPTIAGNTAVGSTLTCTPGTWDGTPDPVLAHKWSRSGTPIDQATGLTYVVKAADQGYGIECGEVAANASGAKQVFSSTIQIP